jgi:hypothetical protein
MTARAVAALIASGVIVSGIHAAPAYADDSDALAQEQQDEEWQQTQLDEQLAQSDQQPVN